MWLVVLVPVTMLLVVALSAQFKALPQWFHNTAFVCRSIFKILGSVALAAFVLLVSVRAFQEAAIWLFPTSQVGYAMKYETKGDHVYVQPKPHDCEWRKAPIGNKYCHFEKVVEKHRAADGTPEVYVTWRKVEE